MAPLAVNENNERTWGNYRLRTRYAVGSAARGNRGNFSGTKIHRIKIEEVIGVIDEALERGLTHPTIGKRFLLGSDHTFSIMPACGCTRGQNAAKEHKGLTDKDVTYTKCASRQ